LSQTKKSYGQDCEIGKKNEANFFAKWGKYFSEVFVYCEQKRARTAIFFGIFSSRKTPEFTFFC
jgi:hypothetical protein